MVGHSWECRSCNIKSHESPVWARTTVLLAAWVMLSVPMLTLAMLAGPYMVLLSPVWIIGGMGLFHPFHAFLLREPECKECGRYLSEVTADDAHVVSLTPHARSL